ncbi:MAG: tRNA (N(6)-L-threonylcarbamoyladenosine(37)-C(2))-methylthiotransferase MtaB [Verrucomicrobia bacterium]|nr:tRNA (N(6)-L-threonylcarbamoyladenosine(37)-C(2))-methylthiotransferase MtaB [Verrucomicrobiota bacterium]
MKAEAAGDKSPRAMVHTIGCRLNEAESQALRDQLRHRGYRIVPFGGKAEVGIINTCTVTSEADAKSRKAVRQFIRTNPEAFTAVIGCSAQLRSGDHAAIGGVDLIIGNHNKFGVLDHLADGKRDAPLVVRDRIDRKEFVQPFVEELPYDKRANLKIQDGCDFLCSFCCIPFARGPSRPRLFANAVAEARAAVRRGIRELVLTGVNVGTYEQAGRSLTDLVDAVAEIPGIRRLRIASIEPTTVDFALLDRMADPAHVLQPLLHLPLQSGSDRILEKMRRLYRMDHYREFVAEAVRRVPGLSLGTDLLVGFPGESGEDFAATRSALLDLPFAYGHVFPYSRREGTLSDKRKDPEVPEAEKARRVAELRELSARRYRTFLEAERGSVAEVLLEDPKADHFPGYTGNYIRVRIPRGSDDLRNRLATVRLGRARDGYMEGKLLGVEETAAV